MTTVETGTAQNIEYIPEETRAVAIHEAGHAAAGHVVPGRRTCSRRGSRSASEAARSVTTRAWRRTSASPTSAAGSWVSLIMTLGAMAAEHVFYGENSPGRQRRRLQRHRDGRVDGRASGRWVPSGPRSMAVGRQGGHAGGAQATRADRHVDHEPREWRHGDECRTRSAPVLGDRDEATGGRARSSDRRTSARMR